MGWNVYIEWAIFNASIEITSKNTPSVVNVFVKLIIYQKVMYDTL